MLSKAGKAADINSDDGEVSETKNGERKKKAVFQLESLPWHYKREVGNMRSSYFSGKAHHVNAHEEAVHFWGLCHRMEISYLMSAAKGTLRSPQGIRGRQIRWMEFLGSQGPKRYTSVLLGNNRDE